MTNANANTYTADLETVRRLLVSASHWPELSHALRAVAEAEVDGDGPARVLPATPKETA